MGAAGSGKTETLLRLSYLAAKVYGWQVAFLDAKGDPATRDRFVAAMLHAGIDATSIRTFPAQHYDAWRGDAPVGYVEVHIEQGPVLESLGLPVGVVTAIAEKPGDRRKMRAAWRRSWRKPLIVGSPSLSPDATRRSGRGGPRGGRVRRRRRAQ